MDRGQDVSLVERGSADRPAEEVVAILRGHREAVQYLHLVAGQRDLSIDFIKLIHQHLTSHQNSVDVVDQFGRVVTLPLIKSDWKRLPNNPTGPDGAVQLYCTPELLQEEMQRLLADYHSGVEAGYPATVM